MWSLYAKDFGIGDEFEISALVAPVPIAKTEPEPAPVKQPDKSIQAAASKETTRNDNILQMKESPLVPDKISVNPNASRERPDTKFLIKPGAERDFASSGAAERNSSIGSGPGIAETKEHPRAEKPEIEIPKPPPARKKPVEESKTPVIVSGGVVNGKATDLPKPAYPAPARAVGASGKVDVQVTIDERGNVISAKAISGHALLRDAAERAARAAKFSPTYLTDKPVKVNGLIVYNFTKN